MFDFPKYTDLIPEQIDAYMDGNNKKLITGPPGTGKTVIALFLAKKLPQDEKVKYLVYNRTLNDYLDYAISQFNEIKGITSTVTWHKWFKSFYKATTQQDPPELGDDGFTYDWFKVRQQLTHKIGNAARMKHIIVDEGQDMPKLFYDFIQFISESYYIFADENQIISDSNSTIKEIKENLGDGFKEYLLKTNHRNTLQIAQLASKYFVGLNTGIPELPTKRKGSKPACYSKPIDTHLEVIKTYCRSNQNKSIGIFLPEGNLVKKIYWELKSTTLANRLDYYHGEKYYDCPECFVGKLVERNGRRGRFWGCNRYNSNNGCTLY